MEKKTLIEGIQNKYLQSFRISECNLEKPWGAYFCIDTQDTPTFIARFFADIAQEFAADRMDMLSPKLLIVLPSQRLSWQYHFRREEFWKVLEGPVYVPLSPTDEEPNHRDPIHADQLVRIPQGTRHRLIGGEHLGIVAEIWKHTQRNHLSDEQDIVRVQDDFGR